MSGTCTDLRHVPWLLDETPDTHRLCIIGAGGEGTVAVIGPAYREDGCVSMIDLIQRLVAAHNARLSLYGPFGEPQDTGGECLDHTDESWLQMGYGGVKDGASDTGFLWCLHSAGGTVMVIEAWDAPGSREVREAANAIQDLHNGLLAAKRAGGA